jgi:hypothetical protein
MTQVAPPAPEQDPGMAPHNFGADQPDMGSSRFGDLSLLSLPPEAFGADTTRNADKFTHVTQSDAKPHQGSEDERYVMGVAQDAHVADDTKTLHALSRGEYPGVDLVDAIELGRVTAEAKLGKIGLKYAEQEAKGIASVPMKEGDGRHSRGGKTPVPPGAGKKDRLFVPSTSLYVTDNFYEHHDML